MDSQVSSSTVSLVSSGAGSSTPSHNFEVHTYKTPHFCDFCGEFIWGLVRQGIKCSNCGMNVHKRCGQKVGNDCRPNSNRHNPPSAQGQPSLPASMGERSTMTFMGTGIHQIDVPKVQHALSLMAVANHSDPSLPHTFDEISVGDQEFDKCDACGGKSATAARAAAAQTGTSRLRLLKCRDCGFTCHKTCQGKVNESCKPVTPPPEPADMSPNGDDSSSDIAGGDQQSGSNDTLPPAPSPKTQQGRGATGGRPPHGAVEMEDAKNQLPLMSISASIKRKNQKLAAQDAQRTGWLVSYTNRDSPHQRSFWRIDTRAIVLHENEDAHSPIVAEIGLDKVVAVEEAVPLSPTSQAAVNSAPANPTFDDMPHVFTIRMPSIIYYCGEDPTFFRRRPDRCDMQRGSGREYALQWMKRIRELCTVLPSIGDTVNIRDLYDIHQDQVLGSGQFGVVYLATSRKDGRVVALKVIDAGRIEKQKLLPEIRILKGINHPGVVSLIDFYDTAQKIYVCMERLERDMLDLILNSPQSRLDERHTKFLVQQILTALKYLHTNHIVHCDLKPENVLLVAEHPYPQVKLCDFGFSRIIGERSFRQSVVGTPAYLAPEVLTPKPRFNKALDMWSVGVIIYVSLSGVFPYNASQDIVSQIRDASFLFPADPWSQISSSAVDLIRRLMDDRVRIRWACHQALKHDWFSKDYTGWCDLRALETRMEASTGRATRWWTDENDDDQWEQLRSERGLPQWEDVGCKSLSRRMLQQLAGASRQLHQQQPSRGSYRQANEMPVPMDVDDNSPARATSESRMLSM